MRKEIKTWGDSAVIVLTKEDLRLYDLQPGNIIEATIIKIDKKELKKNK